ncbi:hypothetical protein KIN20_027104 [Parelaphostrongylus tenuis]|uniref:Uncharacterized protein n=1 Tax=Parelaphostrongylus tenuis TaxID=148309 RepID=A0AAD5WDK5_PARTN|nr:hypothetical protein KIN20_027104 [Parelaphostrongylus tenuis]
MISPKNIANVSSNLLSIFLLTITEVLGCGTLPGGAAAMRTWRFNVTGFNLPVAMAFSTAAATQAQVPGISPSLGSAEALVKRLVIQGVIGVLEQQGRAAGLPDAIIATIWVSSVSTSSTHHYNATKLSLVHHCHVCFDFATSIRVISHSCTHFPPEVLRKSPCVK